MAIVIPSKNIYNKNNPKVRDNVIDNVTVNQTIITPNNEYDIPVYNQRFRNFSIINTQEVSEHFEVVNKHTAFGHVEDVVLAFVSYVRIDNYGKIQISVKIPIVNNNSYIQSILHGTNEQGNTNIKYTLQGYKKSGTVTATEYYDYAEDTFSMSNITATETESALQTFQIPKEETFAYEGYNSTFDISATVPSTVDFADLGTILTAIPQVVGDNFEITFDLISKYRVVKIGNNFAVVGGSKTIRVDGTYEEYIPEQIEITFYGNTIGIDLKDGTIKVNSGDYPFSLDGNELLQDSGTVGEKSISQHLGDNVINQYRKGKETANILCNISDYYAYGAEKSIYSKGKSLVPIYVTNDVSCSYTSTNDYSTLVVTTDKIFEAPITVVVSHRITGATKQTTITIPSGSKRATKKVEYTYGINSYNATLNANMVFEQNDKVIPMVLGADGNDHPMSVYQNGVPKIFTVVGTDIIFDGAVWQQLTLQEYNN